MLEDTPNRFELDYRITSFAFGVKTIVKIHDTETDTWYRLMKHSFANEWELGEGKELGDLTGLTTLYKPVGDEYKHLRRDDISWADPDKITEAALEWIEENR